MMWFYLGTAASLPIIFAAVFCFVKYELGRRGYRRRVDKFRDLRNSIHRAAGMQ